MYCQLETAIPAKAKALGRHPGLWPVSTLGVLALALAFTASSSEALPTKRHERSREDDHDWGL